MASPHITYTPSHEVTAEAELSTLASIYRFVLDCHAKKKAAPESRPDDARKDTDARTKHHCT
jgi:hypothetical protein